MKNKGKISSNNAWPSGFAPCPKSDRRTAENFYELEIKIIQVGMTVLLA